ncbi:hypothetical protein ACVW1C_005712 [Bradyrhizobium sp. USDA 4011]
MINAELFAQVAAIQASHFLELARTGFAIMRNAREQDIRADMELQRLSFSVDDRRQCQAARL